MALPITPSRMDSAKDLLNSQQVYQIDLPTPPITPQLNKHALASLPASASPIGTNGRGRVAVLKLTDTSNINGASSRSSYKLPTTKSVIGPGFTANSQRVEPEDLGLGIADTKVIADMKIKSAGSTSAPAGGDKKFPPKFLDSSGSKKGKANAKAKAKKAALGPVPIRLPAMISKAFVISLPNTKFSTLFPKITGDFKLIESRYRVDNRKPNRDRSINVLKAHVPRKIKLVGTVKLHGAHADIVINQDNTIRLQSRTQLALDGEKDVLGFAATMFQVEKNLLEMKVRIESRWIEINQKSSLSKYHPLIIAGEWVGPGVQKGVALNELSRRLFVITSISVDNAWLDNQLYSDIEDEAAGIVHVARGGYFKEELDVTDLDSCQERAMALSLEIEKICPFGRSFGIVGRGEGVVWKAAHPLGKNHRFWVKTKGPDFAVTKTSELPTPRVPTLKQNPVRIEEDVIERTRQFAFATTTEPRLAQTWDVCFMEKMLPMNKNSMGRFVNWVSRDILLEEMRRIKECQVDEQYLIKCIHWMAELWYESRLVEIEKSQAASSAIETGKVESTAPAVVDETVHLQPETKGVAASNIENPSSWW